MKLLKFILFLISFGTMAQVGIGTTSPNGIMEINSSISGLVYPVVALTATNSQTPVLNPNSGTLVPGTVVYNTNLNNAGINSVYPGTYMWDGSNWIPQFSKRHSEIFFQNPTVLRTESDLTNQDVPGLGVTENKFFRTKYNGYYRVEIRVNFGGGRVTSPVPGDDNAAFQDGTFKFNFNGTTYPVNVKSISTYDLSSGSTVFYEGVWKESYLVLFLDLVAATDYYFSLTFSQSPAPAFNNNGEFGDGRGYVGKDIPCSIEFTYIEDYTGDI
ncbi:hypothetical protein LS48_08170 [Aequorivita aquimaris]|uniref:Uncharacterized protein n=1 Tax=Aequorivita aquimaris TaxID=1548749 RepID=A0A137RHS7_9FLAO|nr:hypothetical protein [Aequorivita aquimaris]KXN99043.1 hypothetical protein LS48_08170 [Aequorivita aquimaris]